MKTSHRHRNEWGMDKGEGGEGEGGSINVSRRTEIITMRREG